MKITDSTVNMAAASTSIQSVTKQTNLEYWVGDRGQENARRQAGEPLDRAEFTELAQELARQAELKAAPSDAATAPEADAEDQLSDLSDRDKQKIQILEDFLYRLTGKRLKFFTLGNEKMREIIRALHTHGPVPVPARPAPQRAGYGLILDASETVSESQTMSFQAEGVVKTEDGRTIDFSVSLAMSRQFQSSAELHFRAGEAARVDPLVINLSGGAPWLSQRDFKFDLDRDGDEEQISRLLAGSGFLALDKNEDGVINNGGELFGPTEGDGFEELKAYDTDGNNWIDENDSIFDKLRIWMADERGNMQLFALGQKGVGALYLGNVASAYDIKDSGNATLGSVQSTGVFLRENGGAGTLQHIDLTV